MEQNIAINPLLTRVRVPGQTFPLPSRGLFYTNGELSPEVVEGELHVYPMTAIDELVMKSVDKVFSGEAVKEIFGRCVPGVLKVGALSAKDIDFLLVALRKVSYGPEFDITYTHNCEGAKEQEYTATLDSFIQAAKTINPVTKRDQFAFTLPNGQIVNFQPATYDDIIKVYQAQYSLEMAGDVGEEPADALARVLESVAILIGDVDGTADRANVVEWLRTIPVLWLREISAAAQKTTSWGITFEVPIVCKDCGAALSVPTPLNPISFFI